MDIEKIISYKKRIDELLYEVNILTSKIEDELKKEETVYNLDNNINKQQKYFIDDLI